MPPDRPPNPDLDARAVPLLLDAYARGQFPMAEPNGEIYLYDPDPRGVIPLEDGSLRVSRSLGQRVRSGRFTITTDRAFSAVIRACAEPRPPAQDADQPGGTWIDERIIAMYEALHRAGHAHSIEAWITPPPTGPASHEIDPLVGQASRQTHPQVGQASRLPETAPDVAHPSHLPNQPRLVGGLYGVHLNGLFAGESMFSRPDLGGTDASKVCLVHLWHHLRARGFTLLDTQFTTPHLERLGAVAISRRVYRARLRAAMAVLTIWEPFDPRLTPGGR